MGNNPLLHYPNANVLAILTCMSMVYLIVQVELDYPFHRAYEKGGGHAVVLKSLENSASRVQKHDDLIEVQLSITTTTSLMVTLPIQSQYQRDIKVLAYAVENNKGKRWAESAATGVFLYFHQLVKRC